MSTHEPSITVLGLYSFSADAERYSRFLRDYMADFDPATYSEDFIAFCQKYNRDDVLNPDPERLIEIEQEMRQLMDKAVMVEVLVNHPDDSFAISGFIQPDPTVTEGNWMVAWNEKFLTSDGEALLFDPEVTNEMPKTDVFRVAFVIHDWTPELPLLSSYGELALPPVQPMPERLWRLAPYESPI